MSLWDYLPPDDEPTPIASPVPDPAIVEQDLMPDEDTLELDPDTVEEAPEVVPGQANLFGDDDQFTVAGQEWQGMPEYVNGDLTPWKSMLVHFASLEDLQAFAELVNQPITTRTKSIWYPASDVFHFIDKRYATEEAS